MRLFISVDHWINKLLPLHWILNARCYGKSKVKIGHCSSNTKPNNNQGRELRNKIVLWKGRCICKLDNGDYVFEAIMSISRKSILSARPLKFLRRCLSTNFGIITVGRTDNIFLRKCLRLVYLFKIKKTLSRLKANGRKTWKVNMTIDSHLFQGNLS